MEWAFFIVRSKGADNVKVFRVEKNRGYTLKGFTTINKGSIDAIYTTVWELGKVGYFTCRKGQNRKCKIRFFIRPPPKVLR